MVRIVVLESLPGPVQDRSFGELHEFGPRRDAQGLGFGFVPPSLAVLFGLGKDPFAGGGELIDLLELALVSDYGVEASLSLRGQLAGTGRAVHGQDEGFGRRGHATTIVQFFH